MARGHITLVKFVLVEGLRFLSDEKAKRIVIILKMVTPSRCFLLENCPMYYPFGNTRARNVLENFKFKEDSVGEGCLIKV